MTRIEELRAVALVVIAGLALGWTWGKKEETPEATVAVESQPVANDMVTNAKAETVAPELAAEPIAEQVVEVPGGGAAEPTVADSVRRLAEALYKERSQVNQ